MPGGRVRIRNEPVVARRRAAPVTAAAEVRSGLLAKFRAYPEWPVVTDPPSDARAVPRRIRTLIAALEAGDPVVVYRWELPRTARDVPWARVVVHPDGTLSAAP